MTAMSMQWKQSVISIKDKQTIISHLEKSEKGTNLTLKFKISKQQISDIHKNKEKILKFTNSVETSVGLKIRFYRLQQHTSTIVGESACPKGMILFFSNIQLLVYYQCSILISWATTYTRLYIIYTSSKKRRLFGSKKGFKSSFN